jgi:hypothetical protein
VITAVDTNVLLDVFGADPTFGPTSRKALHDCLAAGAILVCDAVWAETGAAFGYPRAAESAMTTLGVTFSPIDQEASSAAASAWRIYRAAGGPRTRVVADFLIGAHAAIHADRLLTRDRGFYRRYFDELVVLDPTA